MGISAAFATHFRAFCRKWTQFAPAFTLSPSGPERRLSVTSLIPTWLKIKNPTYTQAEGRRELFECKR